MALYFANKDNFRDMFNKKDKDGNVTVLTPKEVADIALERAEQLAAKMTGGGREYNNFAKKLNKMLNKETKVATKAATKEQKAEVQQVVDSAKDVSAVSTEVADIVKNAKNSTLSREERRNKFKDNLGCK
jgi:predicted phage-related endonuclease